MRKHITIILLFVLVGCVKDDTPYAVLFVKDFSLLVTNEDIAPFYFVNGLEHGSWSNILDEVIYSAGDWSEGLKTGIWNYNIDGKSFVIEFAEYSNSVTDMQISYPNNWWELEHSDKSTLFTASDTTESGYKQNKLFTILAHDKKIVDHT